VRGVESATAGRGDGVGTKRCVERAPPEEGHGSGEPRPADESRRVQRSKPSDVWVTVNSYVFVVVDGVVIIIILSLAGTRWQQVLENSTEQFRRLQRPTGSATG
jgi:hypothetical protein